MESSFVFISLVCCMTVISEADHVNVFYIGQPEHRRLQRTTGHGLCAYSSREIDNGRHLISHLNPGLYTASHRTLPFNSLVNVDTGNDSITVRITDHRTKPGHMLELSMKAAKSLHINSTTPVRCEITLMYRGRNGRRQQNQLVRTEHCKATWRGICRSYVECCSGHCIHTRDSPGFCIPRNFHPAHPGRLIRALMERSNTMEY